FGLDGDVVDEDGGDEYPGDAEPSVDQAIGHRAGSHVHGHVEDAESDCNADGERVDRGEPGGSAADGKEIEESADRNGGCDGGEHRVAQGVEILMPDLMHGGGRETKENCTRNRGALE